MYAACNYTYTNRNNATYDDDPTLYSNYNEASGS